MTPSWKDAPEWAQWLALCNNGDWYWFELQPSYESNAWTTAFGRKQHASSSASFGHRFCEKKPWDKIATWYMADAVDNDITTAEVVGQEGDRLVLSDGAHARIKAPQWVYFPTWRQARTWLVKYHREEWKRHREAMKKIEVKLNAARDWEVPK